MRNKILNKEIASSPKNAPRNDTMAFSLLEVLLASIIFIITISGVFVTLNYVRQPVLDKESALSAAVFGKQVLEALRSKVDASTYFGPCSLALNANAACPDFSLSLGLHQVPPGNLQGLKWPLNLSTSIPLPNNVTNCDKACLVYIVSCGNTTDPVNSPDYTSCTSVGNPDMARRVDLSINWPEAP